jgi:hypothetical protein
VGRLTEGGLLRLPTASVTPPTPSYRRPPLPAGGGHSCFFTRQDYLQDRQGVDPEPVSRHMAPKGTRMGVRWVCLCCGKKCASLFLPPLRVLQCSSISILCGEFQHFATAAIFCAETLALLFCGKVPTFPLALGAKLEHQISKGLLAQLVRAWC